jgi:replicative DNA helicase
MSITKQLLEEIDKGKKGLNFGLPTGIPKLDSLTFGIQKATYYLIGGDSSAGKSSLANQMGLFEPYDYILNNPDKGKVKFIYFSFEMQAKRQFLRGLSRHLYKKDKTIYSTEYLLSRKKSIDDKAYQKVIDNLPYFAELEKHISFYETSLTPKKVKEILIKNMNLYGTFIEKDGQQTYQLKEEWKDLQIIVIYDHASLTQSEENNDTKAKIDKISKIFVDFRNLCNLSIIMLQQFNRGIKSMERKKYDSQEPTSDDFSSSANTFQDADVVIGIAYPMTYGIDTYKGYMINPMIGGFGNRFRGLSLLK